MFERTYCLNLQIIKTVCEIWLIFNLSIFFSVYGHGARCYTGTVFIQILDRKIYKKIIRGTYSNPNPKVIASTIKDKKTKEDEKYEDISSYIPLNYCDRRLESSSDDL